MGTDKEEKMSKGAGSIETGRKLAALLTVGVLIATGAACVKAEAGMEAPYSVGAGDDGGIVACRP